MVPIQSSEDCLVDAVGPGVSTEIIHFAFWRYNILEIISSAHFHTMNILGSKHHCLPCFQSKLPCQQFTGIFFSPILCFRGCNQQSHLTSLTNRHIDQQNCHSLDVVRRRFSTCCTSLAEILEAMVKHKPKVLTVPQSKATFFLLICSKNNRISA